MPPSEWLYGLLCKFPTLDPAWTAEVQAKWFQCFERLWEMGKEPDHAAE